MESGVVAFFNFSFFLENWGEISRLYLLFKCSWMCLVKDALKETTGVLSQQGDLFPCGALGMVLCRAWGN